MLMKTSGLGLNKKIIGLYKEKALLISYLSLLSISVVLILCNVHIGIYLMFMLLGFGWSIFFLGERLNILEHFFTSPLFFLITFLPFSIVFAFFDIPLREWVYILFIIISLVIFIYAKIFKKGVISTKVSLYDYLVLGAFFLA